MASSELAESESHSARHQAGNCAAYDILRRFSMAALSVKALSFWLEHDMNTGIRSGARGVRALDFAVAANFS